MATTIRRPDPPVTVADLLFLEPYRFGFFQAVKLLEQLEAASTPVGHDGPPGREAVRFVAHLAMDFPPSEVFSIEPVEGQPPRMSTPFMGLVGPSGALPTAYTETLIDQRRGRRNAAALDFLDLFHHRLVSLFYRAWEKYDVPSLWERAARSPEGSGRVGDDPFSKHLFDFIGLGLEPLRNRQDVGDESLLFYAGFFAQQHRSAVVLERLIEDHFGRPARVVSFRGQWLRLQDDQLTRVGRPDGFSRLGVEAVVGSKVWDDQSKFRVRLGPLAVDEFRDFLPGGRRSAELMALVRFFARGELDFEVQLVLKAEDVPKCQTSRDPRAASQLGRTSWLGGRDRVQDADDAVFQHVGS